MVCLSYRETAVNAIVGGSYAIRHQRVVAAARQAKEVSVGSDWDRRGSTDVIRRFIIWMNVSHLEPLVG